MFEVKESGGDEDFNTFSNEDLNMGISCVIERVLFVRRVAKYPNSLLRTLQ